MRINHLHPITFGQKIDHVNYMKILVCVACLNKVTYIYRCKHVVVSFRPKQETNDFGTLNSVFSSVEPENRTIISFKLISWYEETLIKC